MDMVTYRDLLVNNSCRFLSYPQLLHWAYNVTVVNDCVFRHGFALRVTQQKSTWRSHRLSRGVPSSSSTCNDISRISDFLNYSPTVKMASIIIVITSLRAQQSIASPTRSSLRYSIPFDKHSNARVAMRRFGTAVRAGSNSRMCAENGGRLSSRRLRVYMYGSSSRCSDLEDRMQ